MLKLSGFFIEKTKRKKHAWLLAEGVSTIQLVYNFSSQLNYNTVEFPLQVKTCERRVMLCTFSVHGLPPRTVLKFMQEIMAKEPLGSG